MFSCLVGACSVVQAELWDLYYGFKIIKDKRITREMLVVSDSAIKVQFLKDGCNLCLLFLMQQGGGYCERSLFDRQMLLIMLLEGFESNDEQSLIGL